MANCESNVLTASNLYSGVPPNDSVLMLTFIDGTTVLVTWATLKNAISGLQTLKIKVTATGLEDPTDYKADYVKAAGNTVTLTETIDMRIEEITKSGTVVSDMNGDFNHNDSTGEIDFSAIGGVYDNDWLLVKFKAL